VTQFRRSVFAVTDRRNPVGGNTLLDQLLPARQRPAFTQSAVVFRGAALVGMTFNDELLVVPAQRGGDCLQFGHFARPHPGTVKIKKDRLELAALPPIAAGATAAVHGDPTGAVEGLNAGQIAGARAGSRTAAGLRRGRMFAARQADQCDQRGGGKLNEPFSLHVWPDSLID